MSGRLRETTNIGKVMIMIIRVKNIIENIVD